MNNLNKLQKKTIIIAVILVITIIGYYVYGRENTKEDIIEDEEILVKKDENLEEVTEEKIIVHITGAVHNEGIVTLKENSRISDAIDAAGGLTEDADMSKINLAYVLEDGVKIKIPSVNDKNEVREDNNVTNGAEIVDSVLEDTSNSANSKSKMININKASQTELETLPGIGPSIALKIINFRNENGKFSSIEDLKKVSGIGENKYENIKNLICVK